MMRDYLMPAIIGSMSAVAIISGLIISGGPARGRAEIRDTTRLVQVSEAADHIRCLARQNGHQLPETAGTHTNCPQEDLFIDPFSNDAFDYSANGPGNFRICMTFELPEDMKNRHYGLHRGYDPTSGCFNFDYNP